MSTDTAELAHIDNDSSLTILPPAQPMQSASVAMLKEHASAMQTAFELADKMCRTQLVPTTYRGKPEDATAAILYGMELGLNPIQALQQVFPVHGQPAIYARTMVALLKARGYKIWTEVASASSVTVMGESPSGQAEASTWDIERATTAGFVPTTDEKTGEYKLNSNGKLAGNMKYLTQPEEMLWAKAASTVCRRLAPEVLLGIAYTAEDLESEGEQSAPRKVRNEASASAPGVDELRERMGITAAPKTTPAEPEPHQVAEPEEAPADDTPESDTAAPSKESWKTLNTLFDRAGIGGRSNADKAKKKTIIETLISRQVEDDTPLTADEVAHVIDQLEQLIAEGENTGRGDEMLIATVDDILAEKAAAEQ